MNLNEIKFASLTFGFSISTLIIVVISYISNNFSFFLESFAGVLTGAVIVACLFISTVKEDRGK